MEENRRVTFSNCYSSYNQKKIPKIKKKKFKITVYKDTLLLETTDLEQPISSYIMVKL